MSGKNKKAKQSDTTQLSTILSTFCKTMDGAKKEYTYAYDEIGKMDKLTQDYLHLLELETQNYKERARVATQLTICRKRRREYKDAVEVLEPLVTFIDGDRGKMLLNMLREVLGRTRKAEEKLEGRSYRYRVIGEVGKDV